MERLMSRPVYIMHIYIKNTNYSLEQSRASAEGPLSLLTLINPPRGFLSEWRLRQNQSVSAHHREQCENYPAFIIIIHAFLELKKKKSLG